MNKSRELIILENIGEYSKALYGIDNIHALFYCELGLVMQAAEVYDEFAKFRRSIIDYLPLLNYADVDFKEWSEKVQEIAITIKEAMHMEEGHLRKESYMHLNTLTEKCVSHITPKSIDFNKFIKLPNLSREDAGHLLAEIFDHLSSLMGEIDGLLHYPEIQKYEELYHNVYTICGSHLFGIEQDLIDEIKQYPQRRKLDFLYELREKGIKDFKQWLGNDIEFKNTFDEQTMRIDEKGMGKCLYNRRRSYFDHYYYDPDEPDTCFSVSQADEKNMDINQDEITEEQEVIDDYSLITAFTPILNFIATIEFVNKSLDAIHNSDKCNISELMILKGEHCQWQFTSILFGSVKDYIVSTKNKGNWDLVKFVCEYLGFIRKCSRKEFAESVTSLMPEIGDSDKLAASMGKCELTNGLTNDKYPTLSDTDPRKIEGDKIIIMFYQLTQMIKKLS